MGRSTKKRGGTAAATQPATPQPANLPAMASPPVAPSRTRSGTQVTVAALTVSSVVPGSPNPAFEVRLDGEGGQSAVLPAPSMPKKQRRTSRRSDSATAAAAATAAPAALVKQAVPLSAAVPEAAPASAEDVLPAAAPAPLPPHVEQEQGVGAGSSRRTRRRKKTQPAVEGDPEQAGPTGGGAAVDGGPADALLEDVAGGEDEEEAAPPKKRRGGGRRRQPDPPPLKDLPTPELVARLQAEGYRPPSPPVPVLGYACLNMTLRDLKPPIFTSRDCIKRTLDAKGLPYLGELCLANCRDLALIIQWNAEHGIRLFRMSSVLFPWMGTFDIEEVPQYADICTALRFAGDLARLHGQRVTFHPSHFVKLATPDDSLAGKSIKELEAHSKILDLMGYPPSCENKINIHVGGVYSTLGSKEATMRRWAENYQRLSPNCRARMTVENDDIASAFSLEDLLFLHSLCGVPLVFDFHHHKFCPGSLTEKEALEAALKTWPPGVRPVVHWSESQEGRKPHAHSDYVRGPIFLHGYEAKVDVMIEAKCKEQALLAYRGDIPFPEPASAGEEPPLGEEEAVALKLL